MKNVSFVQSSSKPKTLGQQELINNLLYGKRVKNKTSGFQSRYNSVGKFKSINVGVYGRTDKDSERLNNLISSYECVLESANKERQRSPFEGRRLTYKDQSSIQMLSNK